MFMDRLYRGHGSVYDNEHAARTGRGQSGRSLHLQCGVSSSRRTEYPNLFAHVIGHFAAHFP